MRRSPAHSRRLLLALVLLLPACAGREAREGWDRPLNPFYEREQTERVTRGQVRPFYWKQETEEEKRVDILGPFIRYRSGEPYTRVSILPNMFYSARTMPEDERTWWFVFFPFLFLGHDDFLVFPIGGYTHGLLGIDQLILVTPFYARIRRTYGDPDDPVTYTVRFLFWPFIAWGSDGRAGGRRTFRIAPFYGRTKGRDGTRSGFVAWPFYSWRRTQDTTSFLVFPFYGRVRLTTGRQTTVLFPFYQRSVNYITGATDTAFWPFWRRARGPGGPEVRRYWPLYEYRRVGFTTTNYVAWPFWRRTYLDETERFARWTWLIPFYRRHHAVSRVDGSEHRKRVLWPVGRWEKYPDGGSETVYPVLSPIDGSIIREVGEPIRPFISVYRRITRPDGERETTYAFGLVQARQAGPWKKVRVLAGLVGWDRRPEGRYLRLLWGLRLRLGDSS